MIIAINTRLLLTDRIEGIGRFSEEILKRITSRHKEHQFIFFFDRKFDPRFIFSDNITPVVLFPPARHPFLWYWYFEYSVTRALGKYKADIFITMDGWLSTRTHVKTVQVLHDLHYEKYPEFLPTMARRYCRHFFPRFVRKASRIVTVSNFIKKEIIETYGLEDDHVDVVYNSTREEYQPLSAELAEQTRNKYSGGEPYFLFIGPVHPRKNPENAIRAFIQYRETTGDKSKLVITGAKMWKHFGNAAISEAMANDPDIIFTGYLKPEELFRVTGTANCLLYVSHYEGFGMPILEAMSCNVPVIASGSSAMPEVAGNAALLVDPGSVDSMVNAMIRVRNNEDLRKSMISKGRSNLEQFSWDQSAENFWDSILKTIS